MTFGCDFWLSYLFVTFGWNSGLGLGKDWVVTFVVTFAETFGFDFWL